MLTQTQRAMSKSQPENQYKTFELHFYKGIGPGSPEGYAHPIKLVFIQGSCIVLLYLVLLFLLLGFQIFISNSIKE